MNEFLARWLFSPLNGITFGRFLRLVVASRGRIPPIYWPRTAFTGLLSVPNTAQAAYERLRHRRRWEAVDVERPLFILGHYRTGTTHLHNLLSLDPRRAFPDYYQVSFPLTFLSTEGIGKRLGQRFTPRERPQDDVQLSLAEPAEEDLALCADTFLSTHMCWHLPRREADFRRYATMRDASSDERRRWVRSMRTLARKLTLRHGKPLIFKSPCHTGKVDLLLEAFPDARFLHIKRHPYDVYRSTRKMELTVPPWFQFQRREIDLDAFILWRYRELYDALFAAIPSIPAGQYHEIAYEELIASPEATLRAGYAALGLGEFAPLEAPLAAYLARIADYRTNRYTELEPAIRERIDREWGRFFEAWGFERRCAG